MIRVQRCRTWWATARSSLIVHRRMKWMWVLFWVVAEAFKWVEMTSLISRLSFIALILGSWSAEEAAAAAVKQEEAEESPEPGHP